jgi:hypothetical protein
MKNTITDLDAEIAKAKKQAAARIAKLKREAAAEQKKIDAKVIELLRTQDPDLYDTLVRSALDGLEARRAKSSDSARRSAAATGSPAPADGDGFTRRAFGEGA